MRVTPIALALAIAVSVVPTSSSGQAITGTVTDARDGRPIPVAAVRLVAIDEVTLEMTASDAEGRYRLVPPTNGIFKVEVVRLGFREEQSDWIVIRDEESHRVDFELSQAPIELDSLRVIAENDGITPGRVKFMRRQALGRGHFITAAEIRAAGSPTLVDVIRILPEMYLDSSAQLKSRASAGNGERGTSGCVRFVWNDFAVAESEALMARLREVYGVGFNGMTGGGEGAVLELIPVSSTAGIEVYPSFDDVPQELRFVAWPSNPPGAPPCGLVVIWDGGGWGNVPEGGDVIVPSLPQRPERLLDAA